MNKLIALSLFGFISSNAVADVTVVRSLRLTTPAGDAIRARGYIRVQGNTSRREADVTFHGPLADTFAYSPRTVTLIYLDQGTVQRLDSQKSQFEKFSLRQWRHYLDTQSDQASQTLRSPFRISQSWSKVLPDNEWKVMHGIDCRKFVYEWRFQIENPETYAKKEYSVKTTLWLADISPKIHRALVEEHAFKTLYETKIGRPPLEDLNGLTLQYAESVTGIDKHSLFAEIQQGTAHLGKIVGYPLASQTEWFLVGKTSKPLFKVDSELETLSLEPLAAAVFNPAVNLPTDLDIDAQLIAQAK